MARALDFVEAWFWLGRVVNRSRALATHGSSPVEVLSERSGVPVHRLYDAAGFHDVFYGDFAEMREWALERITKDGTILQSDVTSLVKANPGRKKAGHELVETKYRIERHNQECSEIGCEEHSISDEDAKLRLRRIRISNEKPLNTDGKPRRMRQRHPLRQAARKLLKYVTDREDQFSSDPIEYGGKVYIVRILVNEMK